MSTTRWRARCRVIEAGVCLLLARAAVKVLPFRWLSSFVQRPMGGPELGGEARGFAREQVNQAVRSAARTLPGDSVCVPRAMAAHLMLRRRGVSSTLHYGAMTVEDGDLRGHVWLTDGEVGIVGHKAARGYPSLARYSPGERLR